MIITSHSTAPLDEGKLFLCVKNKLLYCWIVLRSILSYSLKNSNLLQTINLKNKTTPMNKDLGSNEEIFFPKANRGFNFKYGFSYLLE